MPKQNVSLQALNRGEISTLALARVDVERLKLSAETQKNWLPRVVGPAMLRPGLEYITSTRSDAACRLLPFIYSSTDTALLEFTDSTLRVLVNEAPITRASVTTTVANFSTPASWTSSTSGGGTASTAGNVLTLNLGSVGGTATATQSVALGSGSSGIEHALRIVVTRGPVKFRVGSTSGGDELITSTRLDDGTHSLAFTPTGTFYIQFEAASGLNKIVSSVTLEAAGIMTLPTSYTASSLPKIRYAQSADVVFMACEGVQQQKIERRAARSWSIVTYKADDGPFTTAYSDSTITLTPSATRGNITLTASKNLFKSTNVGSLYRLFNSGQNADASVSAEASFSDAVRVTGVTSGLFTGSRTINLSLSGTWVGTVTLQRSLDGPDSGFIDVQKYTANFAPTTYNDGLNNSIAWYRMGFKAGDYTSGTAVIGLSYAGGGNSGIVRITGYTSATQVDGEVLNDLANTTATRDWREGAWSPRRGYPTAVELHEGRLWFAGNDRVWGSVSDAYTSFDIDFEGDAGPIDRTIGKGPIARISWLISLVRLLMGTDRSVTTAKSSSFDEPLTPTNFNLTTSSTQGTYTLPAVKVDTRAVYVQASNRRIYEILFDVQEADYKTSDLTRLNPDIGVAGIVDLDVQRQPDTFVHFVRADGQVAVLLYDPQDQVEAWWRIETNGVVENVCVLPGTLEDKVYYVVKRTIGGVTKRYIERFARLDQCQGGTLSRCADSHLIYQGAATTTITGLSHLEGQTVVVWADGKDVGTKIVTSGQITLAVAAANVCVGLSYDAVYKSSKLAYAAANGTALTQKKRVHRVGLIMANTHYQGLRFGPDENNLNPLPLSEMGTVTPADTLWQAYDQDSISFPGQWDTDSRVVLKAQAPRPCTIMAIEVEMQTNG